MHYNSNNNYNNNSRSNNTGGNINDNEVTTRVKQISSQLQVCAELLRTPTTPLQSLKASLQSLFTFLPISIESPLYSPLITHLERFLLLVFNSLPNWWECFSERDQYQYLYTLIFGRFSLLNPKLTLLLLFEQLEIIFQSSKHPSSNTYPSSNSTTTVSSGDGDDDCDNDVYSRLSINDDNNVEAEIKLRTLLQLIKIYYSSSSSSSSSLSSSQHYSSSSVDEDDVIERGGGYVTMIINTIYYEEEIKKRGGRRGRGLSNECTSDLHWFISLPSLLSSYSFLYPSFTFSLPLPEFTERSVIELFSFYTQKCGKGGVNNNDDDDENGIVSFTALQIIGYYISKLCRMYGNAGDIMRAIKKHWIEGGGGGRGRGKKGVGLIIELFNDCYIDDEHSFEHLFYSFLLLFPTRYKVGAASSSSVSASSPPVRITKISKEMMRRKILPKEITYFSAILKAIILRCSNSTFTFINHLLCLKFILSRSLPLTCYLPLLHVISSLFIPLLFPSLSYDEYEVEMKEREGKEKEEREEEKEEEEDDRRLIFLNIIDRSASLWSNEQFVRTTSESRHNMISTIIIWCLQFLLRFRDESSLLSSSSSADMHGGRGGEVRMRERERRRERVEGRVEEVMQRLLFGVNYHLASSSSYMIRRNGMMVGEYVSLWFNSIHPLRFEYNDDDLPSFHPTSSDDDDNEEEEEEDNIISLVGDIAITNHHHQNKTKIKRAVIDDDVEVDEDGDDDRHQKEHQFDLDRPFIPSMSDYDDDDDEYDDDEDDDDRTTQKKGEDDDEDGDDDDEFESYNLEEDNEDDLQSISPPIYLRDCIHLLRSNPDQPQGAESIEVALKAAYDVIMREPADLHEFSVQIASSLLYIENPSSKIEDKMFEELRFAALSAITQLCAADVIVFLCAEFYSARHSVLRRILILQIISDAAKSICQKRSSPIIIKEKEEVVSDGFILSPAHMNVVRVTSSQTDVIGRSRYISRSKHKRDNENDDEDEKKKKINVNRFDSLSSLFFFSLIRQYNHHQAHFDMLGEECIVLAEFIYTLGVIIECSSGKTANADNIAVTLLQMITVLKYHDQSSVRANLLFSFSRIFSKISMNGIEKCISEVVEIKEWLEWTIENDADERCRSIAAICYIELKHVISPSSADDQITDFYL